MAQKFTQLPGVLSIDMVQGDELALSLDFDRSLEWTVSGSGTGSGCDTYGTTVATEALADEYIAANPAPADCTAMKSGYTIEAPIYVLKVFASGVGGSGSVETVGDVAANFTVNVTDAASGQIQLGLSEAQTLAMSTAIAYRWYLRWVAPGLITRTVLSGTFNLVNP